MYRAPILGRSIEPIDLFGYGTSGYNNIYPYMTSKIDNNYTAPNTAIAKTEYDWGWYNAISNGGNTAEQWYSLNSNEWKFLFNTRATTTIGINGTNSARYTYASINGINGIILFPDLYIHPSEIDLTGATFNSYSNFTATITISDWQKLEAAGAVFIPAAGKRIEANQESAGCHKIDNVFERGMYWTGGTSDRTYAFYVNYSIYGITVNKVNGDRHIGMSVRVVKDI